MNIKIQDNFNNTVILLDPEKVSYTVCEKWTYRSVSAFYEVIKKHKDYFSKFEYFYKWKCYTISRQEIIIIIYDDNSQNKMEQAIKFGAEFTEPVFAIIHQTY